MAEQRASYTALLERLGKALPDEIEAVLAERAVVEPAQGLRPADSPAGVSACQSAEDQGEGPISALNST